MNKFHLSRLLFSALFFAFALTAFGQSGISLTAADYERAERFMGYNTGALVDRGSVQPRWLPDGRFWYRVLTAQGSEFVVVNPSNGTRQPLFDQTRLAAALSTASGGRYEAARLPFATLNFSPDGKLVMFAAAKKSWKCDIQTYSCAVDDATTSGAMQNNLNGIASPDGKRIAFIRNWNLWVRDNATNRETQLTTDGVENFGYATDNAGWRKSDRPVLLWSPDSRKIATYLQDQRFVSDMYLVSTNVGAPKLQSWKYPLPTDKDIIRIHRVVIEVDAPKVIRLDMRGDARRGTLCDDIACGENGFDDVEWNADATKLAFVSTSRDHKEAKMRVADALTGEVREVFEETSATQYESGQGSINWRYLPTSNEIIWYSERDGWGHLYLYNLTTGKLKNQITKGDFVVTQMLRVDEQTRTIYFLAGGRERGRNPYYSHFYKIDFDGGNLKMLTPEDANHFVSISPSGHHFIDTYSKSDTPPVIVLRDMDGRVVVNLEKADISRLTAAGWKPPTAFTVKARDNQTELYGIMYTPSNLDASRKYPVVNYIYPGPQGGSVGTWGFAHAVSDHQALAELGFIVVAIEGTCNPLRSKKFHDMCYGNMADNTLPDQISGLQQLAQKYPYMDLTRVGVWGHSGGGFATAAAMFRYPEFYKVGISESGNHDNRNYEDDWGERYIGLISGNNYENQANQNFAKNLKGKLLLAHGMMDDNVPPYNTLLVVDALIKANKDFDLIMLPQQRHGYGNDSSYMTRRRWDYFVRYLMGANPPQEYQLKMKPDPRNTFQ
jgi:dipeptidyl aminopeptidase/acylaminoacyl peptidase